jgi:hypothetical protein
MNSFCGKFVLHRCDPQEYGEFKCIVPKYLAPYMQGHGTETVSCWKILVHRCDSWMKFGNFYVFFPQTFGPVCVEKQISGTQKMGTPFFYIEKHEFWLTDEGRSWGMNIH